MIKHKFDHPSPNSIDDFISCVKIKRSFMAFEHFKKRLPEPMGISKRFGLMIPLIMLKDEWHVLFEERAHTMRSQPGEICFPGGKVEENESYQEAAVRETVEEIGIDPDLIEVIAPLDYLLTPFNYALYPHLAILHIKDLAELRPNHTEVADLFTVPLNHFLTHDPECHVIKTTFEITPDFPYDKIQNGEAYHWKTGSYDVLFYEVNNRIIWGLTAKIVSHFSSLQRFFP